MSAQFELLKLDASERAGMASTEWYARFVDCVTDSYIEAAKYEGAMFLTETSRVIDSMEYQWESGGGALLDPNIALLSYFLLKYGRISDSEAADMVAHHFDCSDTSEANQLLLEHLDDYHFEDDVHYLEDIEHVGSCLTDDVQEEFRGILNQFAAILDIGLRLTYTGYDQIGGDAIFNATEWATVKDITDLHGVKETDPFITAKGDNYECYDMHLYRINPIRGGGFSCSN